eukprot:3086299-Ditylum_brightwellii.AAC.1
MASFLRSWLATLIVRALFRRINDDTLDTLFALGEGQVFKVAHHVHVVIVLFDCLINLVSVSYTHLRAHETLRHL